MGQSPPVPKADQESQKSPKTNYFSALSAEVIKQIELKDYRFNSLPEDIQEAIIIDCQNFKTLPLKDKENLLAEVAKLHNPPEVFVKLLKQHMLTGPLAQLPFELFDEIGKYLEPQAKSHIAQACIATHSIFQPQLDADKLTHDLLWYVASGNQVKAQAMLKMHPELLLRRGNITDFPGRTFENITAFEYAVWALDVRYMAPMMLDCVPRNEKGKEIWKALDEQFNRVEGEGLTYTLNETKFDNSRHYDFTPLINALQTYVTNFGHWSFEQLNKYWHEIVWKAQFETVSHVAQHYCDNIPFDPTPNFNAPEFERGLQFYNHITSKTEYWWPRYDWCFGYKYGIVKGNALGNSRGGGAVALGVQWGRDAARSDLAAITALCKTRTEDCQLLKQRLQAGLGSDAAPSLGDYTNF